MNVPWKELESKKFPSPLLKFVDNYKNNKTLGEQHYVGLNKRDLALKEKEEKAKELVKNTIFTEDDPDNDLYDNFCEFVKMKVNLLEEEIAYEEIGDYQGSTYPENNMLNKKQTTPSQGSATSSQTGESNQSNDKEPDYEQDEKQSNVEVEYHTLKDHDKTNKNIKPFVNSIPDNNMPDESEAIIQEILGEDCDISVKLSVANGKPENLKYQSKPSGHNRSSKGAQFNEKEVPLLTQQERMELESVVDNIDVRTEAEAFVLTPERPKKAAKHQGIMVPATRQIKHKAPVCKLNTSKQ